MISEIETKIGNCERVFDLAKARLEKIVIAFEEEAELHGAPPQKLLYDLATATADFSVAIEELNAAYALRDSKQPALRVPPVENYIELLKKNAAAKREARDAARRSEAEDAGQLAAWLHTIGADDDVSYSQKLANSTAAAARQLSENRPGSEPPAPVTLTEKIASVERQINSAKVEVAYLDEQLRPVRRARAASRLGELRPAKSPEVLFAEEQLAAKKADLVQLIAQHKTLLAERQSQRGSLSLLTVVRQ
jgi:hypothetical protein